MKKTAVITDATSVEFFFPLWTRYYGGLFAVENLFIVTYQGMKRLFQSANVGNVWEVNAIYSDSVRARVISQFVSLLLETYDVVLRCDIDEFLVPNKNKYRDLVEFVELNTMPFVTANGVDIVEMPDDLELDFDTPVLAKQRRIGLLSTPLNKTSLTTTPITWAAGFHAASVFPRFSNLYNFHLKYADIRGRQKWNRFMQESVAPNSREFKYFVDSSEHLSEYQKRYANMPRSKFQSDFLGQEFDRQFIDSVNYNASHVIYQGHFKTSDSLVEIGVEFESAF